MTGHPGRPEHSEQKAELLAILDRAAQLKLNAVIFQVRPACDAMYASRIEPWSEYLTGTMGKAPEPFYDPLAFAVEEAHKRGLELHAWFNPYRAGCWAPTRPPRPTTSARPIRSLSGSMGDTSGWTRAKGQDYSLSVVMDVVKRYDVDGVHFDDYFYPYKERMHGKGIGFPRRRKLAALRGRRQVEPRRLAAGECQRLYPARL